MQPVEKTIVDRCVRLVCRNCLNDPGRRICRFGGDLQNELRRQNEKEAQYLTAALEICVSGFLNVFNRRTNTIRSNADRIPGTDAREAEKEREQERR